MNEYSAELYGTDLATDTIADALSTLKCAHQSATSIRFETPGMTLRELLDLLLENQAMLNTSGVSEVTIWALLTRKGQINDELRPDEIKSLAKLNATFCWSVISE